MARTARATSRRCRGEATVSSPQCPLRNGRRRRALSWTGNPPSRQPLIGRDREIADVAALIGRGRLATIVGPGGVGKTRLAIAAGWRTADAFADGVWLVDLAPLSDPSLVVSAFATARPSSTATLHDDPTRWAGRGASLAGAQF
jgi:hypothetical protein